METEVDDSMEADDVTMLKQLEKNLLRLQLSGIAGISKVGYWRVLLTVAGCWLAEFPVMAMTMLSRGREGERQIGRVWRVCGSDPGARFDRAVPFFGYFFF